MANRKIQHIDASSYQHEHYHTFDLKAIHQHQQKIIESYALVIRCSLDYFPCLIAANAI